MELVAASLGASLRDFTDDRTRGDDASGEPPGVSTVRTLVLDDQGRLGPHLERDRSTTGNQILQCQWNLRNLVDQGLPVVRHSETEDVGPERPIPDVDSWEVRVRNYSQTTNSRVDETREVEPWGDTVSICEVHHLTTLESELEVHAQKLLDRLRVTEQMCGFRAALSQETIICGCTEASAGAGVVGVGATAGDQPNHSVKLIGIVDHISVDQKLVPTIENQRHCESNLFGLEACDPLT